ncbi:MAG TPA: tripartite tricarboxylate transporter permease [Burkholderiales bacterium]|nr:tripartite tricarboxylate transporter permease [Burkholderiales bacterium]
MELLSNLALGFATALSPMNLFLGFVGCLVGTLIGVLPGVGPIATIAMLMPLTLKVDPTGALIMLAGIYYGAQYGGSTTAILVNMPGEVTAVVTAIDGHEMAKRGSAGRALGIAALGSFFAGSVATLIIAAIGAPLTRLALLFGPAEYFGLMVFGLGLAIVLARGSVLKALIMVVLGLLLSTVGTDLETGQERLTLGIPELSDGVDFAVLAMGVFGIAEILRNLENPESRNVAIAQIGRLLPSREDLRRCFGPIVRATGIGSLLGILPGNGAVLGPFASYALEKKLAKDPSRFGRGAIEGVAGPESANNAGAQTSFIPLLTLGIPPNAVMALMVGAMTIHGLIPGPQVMTKHPALFWGMIASMWIGNLLLLVINLPLIGLWVRLLKVPYRLMFTTILLFCAIGIYSINNNPYDVYFTAFFGLAGYMFIKLGLEPAPMLLGFVLGRLMEEKLRQALALSEGSLMTFVERPVAAVLLAIAAAVILIAVLPAVSRSRQKAFQE